MSYIDSLVNNFSAFADDALNANSMNVNPSGRQPLMRPGWYVRAGVRFRQSMVFEGGPYEGEAKGLREVCLERFGGDSIKGKNKINYRFHKENKCTEPLL